MALRLKPSRVGCADITVLLSLFLLTYTIFFYLPQHINFLRRRAAFYLAGDESATVLGSDGVELVGRWWRGLREVDVGVVDVKTGLGEL